MHYYAESESISIFLYLLIETYILMLYKKTFIRNAYVQDLVVREDFRSYFLCFRALHWLARRKEQEWDQV